MFTPELKKLYAIVGDKKFLKIVDAIHGKLYIPSRSAIVRDILTSNKQVFLEEMGKSDNIHHAAKRFNVTERTIYNWFKMALSPTEAIDIDIKKVLPK